MSTIEGRGCLALSPGTVLGPLSANGRVGDRGARVSSGGLVAGDVAVGVAVGGSRRASLRA